MPLVPTPIQGELTFARFNTINLNSTGDLASVTGLPASIIVDKMEILNWSTTPSVLLTMTLRDAASGAGNSLLGSIAALNTPITATTLAAVALPLATVLGAVRVISTGALYLNASAANGSALTADIQVSYRSLV